MNASIEAKRRIRDLRNLGPDWDGPGSPEVPERARESALAFVDRLYDREPRLKVPTVTPTPQGGVFLEWHHPKRGSVAFTVAAEGGIEFSCDDGRGTETEGVDPWLPEHAAQWMPLMKKHRA